MTISLMCEEKRSRRGGWIKNKVGGYTRSINRSNHHDKTSLHYQVQSNYDWCEYDNLLMGTTFADVVLKDSNIHYTNNAIIDGLIKTHVKLCIQWCINHNIPYLHP